MSAINTIVVLDTETTDLDPDTGAEICEIAWVVLDRNEHDEWIFGTSYSTLIQTQAAFSPVARAAHHIPPETCQPGRPNTVPRDELIGQMLQAEVPGEMYYAAHNSPFDMKFLPELTLGTIDTYQCAKHIWPDAPKYGNQVLRYYLGVEPPPELLEGLAPHRALYDAACTAAVLAKALEQHSPEEMLRLSTTPILLKTCSFGKHEGKLWSEVPLDYLSWMVRSNDMYRNNVDMRHTVDHYLNRRTNALPI